MSSKSRLRESAAVLAAIAAVIALTSAFSVASVAYLNQQAGRGIQSELSTRSGADLALRASLSLATNADRQDAQVRSALAASFARTGVDLTVVRTLSAHVTVYAVSDDSSEVDRGGSAQSYPDFADRADVVTGSLPVATTDVAVQADAAEVLGLAVGDDVLIAGVPFRVCGTWRAKDVLDPRWFGDRMIAIGFDDDYGPLVIDERAWSRIDSPPTATWTVIPDVSQIDAANIDDVMDAWAGIRDDWRGTVDGLETLTPQNRLVQTLAGLDTRLAGLRAVEPVIFTLIAAVALVGLAELVRLLLGTRRRVTELYWARGDSRRGIAGRAGRDVALAAVLGALVGACAAAGTVVLTAGPGALRAIGWIAAVPPAVAVSGAVLFAVLSPRPQPALRESPRRRGARRVRRLALPGVVVLVSLAAALSIWQLRLYGSPLTPTVDGAGDVDPIAVVAPAFGLSALVLVCAIVFPRVAALNERWVHRGRLTSQLAARGVIRRAGLLLAPLVLMALAVGSTTLAAAYSATWDTAFRETAALRAGSDLHADARVDAITPAQQDAVRAVDGVSAVAPIEVQPLSIGGESGTLIGAAPGAVAALAPDIDGLFDPRETAALLGGTTPGPVLPDGATGFDLTVETAGFAAPPALSVYLSDEVGFLRPVPLGAAVPTAGDPSRLTYSATDLPAPESGSWRIASIDAAFTEQSFLDQQAELHIAAIRATGPAGAQDVPLDVFWIADSAGLPIEAPLTDGRGTGMFLVDDLSRARLTPSLTGTVQDEPRPPIVVSQQLADRLDLRVGGTVAFGVQDGVDRLSCVVAGIVPAIPGAPTESAALIDLAVIQHFQLRTTAAPAYPRDLWVSADDPESVHDAIRQALPGSARIATASDTVGRQILGSAAIALWAAAGTIVLLALAGIASSAGARLRSGRNDVAVLRALGVGVADQARIPVGELRTVLVVGAVSGLVAGLAIAALTIPYFARAAVTAPFLSISTALRIDLVGAAVLLGVLALGTIGILLAVAARVRALVDTAVPGEDAE